MTRRSPSPRGVLMLAICMFATPVTRAEERWSAHLQVQAAFPRGLSADIVVELPAELRRAFTIRSDRQGWLIRPVAPAPVPARLNVEVSAAGFRRQTVTTALTLGNGRGKFTATLLVVFEPDAVPVIGQIVAGADGDVATLEITFVNPGAGPMSIRSLGFEAHAGAGACYSAPRRYQINLAVSGKGVVGAFSDGGTATRVVAQVHEDCGTEYRLSFPVDITLVRGTSDHRFTLAARALKQWRSWAWRVIASVRLADGDLRLTSEGACFFEGCSTAGIIPRRWQR